ncbi:hypothetical protein CXG81DRAFT_19049 [Caulochytrium protostelioides]|nr:hypothetical protein CXG81DRAFT_19049 [Caulochytrium protostelioides]|eukprot:RKP01139.1 hypothetical protein CXG81DRAFT_19049 [Caulochytrium protostelioides]
MTAAAKPRQTTLPLSGEGSVSASQNFSQSQRESPIQTQSANQAAASRGGSRRAGATESMSGLSALAAMSNSFASIASSARGAKPRTASRPPRRSQDVINKEIMGQGEDDEEALTLALAISASLETASSTDIAAISRSRGIAADSAAVAAREKTRERRGRQLKGAPSSVPLQFLSVDEARAVVEEKAMYLMYGPAAAPSRTTPGCKTMRRVDLTVPCSSSGEHDGHDDQNKRQSTNNRHVDEGLDHATIRHLNEALREAATTSSTSLDAMSSLVSTSSSSSSDQHATPHPLWTMAAINLPDIEYWTALLDPAKASYLGFGT